MLTDHNIYENAVTALKQALGPVGRKVGMTISDGVITLTGYVTTVEQKRAAEEAVASVRGVRAIAEGLHVIGESSRPLSDTTIAHQIVGALGTIASRPPVTVRVEDGWVTLGGFVSSATDYQRV